MFLKLQRARSWGDFQADLSVVGDDNPREQGEGSDIFMPIPAVMPREGAALCPGPKKEETGLPRKLALRGRGRAVLEVCGSVGVCISVCAPVRLPVCVRVSVCV